jgi:hypothetical protein
MWRWLLYSLHSSIALVKFANQADNQQFVIVGVAKDLQLNPRQVGGGFLYTYKLVNLNSFDQWRVCVGYFLLLNSFILMQGVTFQWRCVFWPSSLWHFRWLATFQRSMLAPSSDFHTKQYPSVTLSHVMTVDHNVNFHCMYSAKNIIMMSLGYMWKSRWMSGRKNPEVYLVIISDAELFWYVTIFINWSWVSTWW